MLDICEALVLHELGALVGPAKNFSIQEAYLHSDNATPVIFILPNVSCQQETEQHHSHSGMCGCMCMCAWERGLCIKKWLYTAVDHLLWGLFRPGNTVLSHRGI